jgi:uncharacterized iron-regulated membrane protein
MIPRKILFWSHLAAGFIAGAILLFMASTGMLLAFAPQLIEWSEGSVSKVEAAPGAVRLPPSRILEAAGSAFPEARFESLLLKADPTAAALIGFPKGEGGLYLDPYSGALSGKTSALRGFFRDVEHWHRWMGDSKRGEFLTHAAAPLLLFMVLSGWLLWIPRRWNRTILRASLVPDSGLRGKARDRNLHFTFGFWSGSLLLIISLTGSVMAYRWAEGLLFNLAGSEAPRPPGGKGGEGGGRGGFGAGGIGREGLGKDGPGKEGSAGREGREAQRGPAAFDPVAADSLFRAATEKAPEWKSILLRAPQRNGAPATAMIEEKGFMDFPRRSRLSADAGSGEIRKWEPYADQEPGRKLRSWMTPIHTGRGFGVAGQCLVALAAFSLALLVWTGIALGARRIKCRGALKPEPLPTPPTAASASGNSTTNPRHTDTR